ncbi:MAG: type IV pilus assembly protein PilM [Veillonellales bacterium]
MKQNRDAIGLDIGTSSIKLAEVVWQKERPLLKNLGIAALPEKLMGEGIFSDAGLLTELIRNLLATSGAVSSNVVAAIGSRSVFIREVLFPAMSAEELKEAVKWDMEKYVPYEPDSYYYDFAVVGPGETELELKILLTAAPKENVNELVTVLKNCGLKPRAVDIEPLALLSTLSGADNAVIVDIGGMFSQVILFQQGSPVAARAIPLGGNRFTEVIRQSLELPFAEAEHLKQRQQGLLQRVDAAGKDASEIHQQMELLVNELAREVQRTIEYYRIQHKAAAVEKIFLAGGGARLANLAPYLAAQMDIPLTVHDPFGTVETAASFDRQYLTEIAPQYAVALGLALRGGVPL